MRNNSPSLASKWFLHRSLHIRHNERHSQRKSGASHHRRRKRKGERRIIQSTTYGGLRTRRATGRTRMARPWCVPNFLRHLRFSRALTIRAELPQSSSKDYSSKLRPRRSSVGSRRMKSSALEWHSYRRLRIAEKQTSLALL